MPCHATLRLVDNALICPTPALRRRVARSIARIGVDTGLVAWAFPDNHGHLAISGSPEAASHLAWRIELAIQAHRGAGSGPFQHRWLRSNRDHGYLWNTTNYILRQSAHHGTHSDPFGESDCRIDILGLRCIAPWVRSRVRELVPRLSDEEVAQDLGLDLDVLRSWAVPLEEGDGVASLAEATRAVFALSSLRGSTPEVQVARAAAVHACADSVGTGRLGQELGISGDTVRRIRKGTTAGAELWLPTPFLTVGVRAVAAQARWRSRAELGLATGLVGRAASPG